MCIVINKTIHYLNLKTIFRYFTHEWFINVNNVYYLNYSFLKKSYQFLYVSISKLITLYAIKHIARNYLLTIHASFNQWTMNTTCIKCYM